MKSQPVASIQRNCSTRARTVLESQEILVKTCVPVATATTGCTGTQTSFKQPKAFRKYPQGVEPRCWSSVLACSASFASGSLPLPSLRFRRSHSLRPVTEPGVRWRTQTRQAVAASSAFALLLRRRAYLAKEYQAEVGHET